MAKATQKILSEPKINHYYRIHPMDLKSSLTTNLWIFYKNEFEYLFQSYVLLMKITILFFKENNCRFEVTKMVKLSDEFVISLLLPLRK